MKTITNIRKIISLCGLLICLIAGFQNVAAQTAYTWTGNISNEWGNPNNWSPNGVPDFGDDVTIVSGANDVMFEEISALNNFTINSGNLDLNLFTIVINGQANFNGGTITNGAVSFNGSSVTFAGTTFDCNITAIAPVINLNGSTFNNPVVVTKTSSGDGSSTGGNTFNSTFQFTNSGSGNYFLSTTSPDTYGSTATFRNTGSGLTFVAHTAIGNSFNGNIVVVSTGSSQGIRFGQNGGTSTLASSRTITIGGSGFSAGELRLKNFTQTGSTSQSMTGFSGTSMLTIETGTTFNGNVTFTAPQIQLNGGTFNGSATITKSGASNNTSAGGNTFNGATTLALTGSGDMILGGTDADEFENTLTCNVSGAGAIFLAHTSTGNQFKENITVTSSGASSGGVRFGQNGGTSTLASGKTISIGGAGFANGSLRFRNFTQSGATAQTISQTSGTSQIYFETGTTFNGNVTISFPQVFLNGTTFNGTASITKNGATNNISEGGNTFASTTSLINTGSGSMVLGNTSADVFNGVLTVTSSGSNRISLAENSTGNEFNQNILVNSTGSSTGIFFGQGTGTSTLASGRTLSVETSFTSGTLGIKGLTQTGSTAQNINNISGTAVVSFESGTVFNAAVTVDAQGILFSGTTFNSTASFNKSGVSNDDGVGGCTFNSTTTITNAGDGNLTFATVSGDIFNGEVTFNNTGTALIQAAHAGSGTQYNENIILNNSALGIHFGQAGGTSTLASGKTITIGGSGFTSGSFRLKNFTQAGTTTQSLTTFGSSVDVYMETGTTFNGTLTLTANNLYLNGSTYAAANITKTGSSNITCLGGNTFNQASTITNSGTGIWYLAGTNADDFNHNITFSQTNANTLYPAYTANSTFARNVSTSGTSHPITFGENGGTAIFDGNVTQQLIGSNSTSPVFKKASLDKTGGILDLSVRMTITESLTLTSGRIKSSNTNILLIEDDATVSGANNNSFVSGPVSKIGDEAFTFPVGKGSIYRPIAISAPSDVASRFTGEFFLDNSDNFYTHDNRDASIHHLSTCEYWILDRNVGSSAVYVTLSWNTSSCGVTNLADLRVCRWNGTTWKDHGNGVTTGNTTAGTIRSSGTIGSFSPFTLGSSSSENPLPIELIHFSAQANDSRVDLKWTTASETNNHFFSIERSKNAVDFEEIGKISGAGNSNTVLNYQFTDFRPFGGISYYRLKQVDFDGKVNYSATEAVQFKSKENPVSFTLSPNPANDWVNISPITSFENIKTIEIIDIKGKSIITFDFSQNPMQESQFKFNTESLQSGIYFIKTSNGLYTYSQKLIITK
jgi:hypothetical protein